MRVDTFVYFVFWNAIVTISHNGLGLAEEGEITQDVIDAINEFVAHANRLVEFSSQDKIEVTIKF